MPRRKAIQMQEFDPIPSDKQEQWDDLVARSKIAAKQKGGAQFQLILLAGEVETNYGDKSIKRWAEEIGISFASARQYRTLSNRGIDKKFVEKWSKLSYTVV